MKIHNIITVLAFVLMFQSSGIAASQKAQGKGKKGNTVFELMDGTIVVEGPLSLPSFAELDDRVLEGAIKEGNADMVHRVLKAKVRPTQKHVALAERLGHKGLALLLKGTISAIEGMISEQLATAAGGAGDSQSTNSMSLAAAINAGFPAEAIQAIFRQGIRATPEHIKLAEQKGRRDIADLLKKDLEKHSPAQPKKASSQSSVTSPAIPKSETEKDKEKKDKKGSAGKKIDPKAIASMKAGTQIDAMVAQETLLRPFQNLDSRVLAMGIIMGKELSDLQEMPDSSDAIQPAHVELAEYLGRKDVAAWLRETLSATSKTGSEQSKPDLKEKNEKERKATPLDHLSDFVAVSAEEASEHLESAIGKGDERQVALLMAQGVKPTQAQINKAEQMDRSDIVDLLTGKHKAGLRYGVTWKKKVIATFSKDTGLSQAEWNRQVKKTTQEQIERAFSSDLTTAIEKGDTKEANLLLFLVPYLKNIPKSLDEFIQKAQLKGHSDIVEMLKESNEKLKTKHAEEAERERQQAEQERHQAEAKKREQQEKERARQEAALQALRQKKEKEERGKAQFEADQRRHQEKEAAKKQKAEQAKQEAERQKAEQERIKMQAEADREKAKNKQATKKAAEQEAARLKLLEKQKEKQKEEQNRLENELLAKVRTLVAQSRQIMRKVAELKIKKYETIADYAFLVHELKTQKGELDAIATQVQRDKKTITAEDKLRRYSSSAEQIAQAQTQLEADLTQAQAEHTRLQQTKEQAEQARLAKEQEEQNKKLKEQEQAKQAAELERARSQQDLEKEKRPDLHPAPVEDLQRIQAVPVQRFEYGAPEKQKIEEAEFLVRLESLANFTKALKKKSALVKPLETLEEYDAFLSKLKDDLPLFENLYEQAKVIRQNRKEIDAFKGKLKTIFCQIEQDRINHKILISRTEEMRAEVQKALETEDAQQAASATPEEPESTTSEVSAPALAQTSAAPVVGYQYLPYPTVAQQAQMAPPPAVGHFHAPVQTAYHYPHYAQGYPYQMGAGYSVPAPMQYAPQINTYPDYSAYQHQHVQRGYAMPGSAAMPTGGYQMAAGPVPYPSRYMQTTEMGAGYPYASAPTVSLPAHAIDESTMLQQMKESEAGFLTDVRNAIAKECVRQLSGKPLDKDTRDSMKDAIEKSVHEKTLRLVVEKDDIAKATVCLSKFSDIDINSVGDSGRSALQIAVKRGNEAMKALLIKHGAQE